MTKLSAFLRWQPAWVIAVSVYSGLLLHGFQWRLHSLFWDHRNIFPAFAEYYHSLNHFGELQWWSHNDNGGVPAYYLNILAHNFLTPLSIVSSSIWWALGRAGVLITDWLPYYCLYHMMFVPAVFLGGFYCFLCQFVQRLSARLFGLILAAFGPAAVIMVLARTRRWRYMHGASVVLLALMFVDISTNAFWWVRTVAAPITFKQGRQDFTPRPEAEQRPAGDYSGSLLVHRAVLDAETRYGNRLRELPQVALTMSARPLGYSQSPVTELLANGIVEIPTEELQTPTLSAFGAEQSKGEPAIGASVAQTERTYNSIRLTVTSDRPGILFNKILYDSPWTVEVNGKGEVSTVRAFGAYLGVVVPAGKSEIWLLCKPSLIEMVLGISILWLGICGVLPLLMNGGFRGWSVSK